MKHQALLTIQAKQKLAIKLILKFLIFGRDSIWRIPRKRVARGGKRFQFLRTLTCVNKNATAEIHLCFV